MREIHFSSHLWISPHSFHSGSKWQKLQDFLFHSKWHNKNFSISFEMTQQKFFYIYNIMSYPTFWHQKNLKNPAPQLWYLSIFLQKFTTIVNFTISVKNWHHFSKIHCFTESVKKFAFKKFSIILRKIHYFIE